jgi:hypothetical protein
MTSFEWILIIIFFTACIGYDRIVRRLKRIEYLLKKKYMDGLRPDLDDIEEELENIQDKK